ncbi:hypothetical protein DVH24_006631 [Malus domestica]|uniref:Uncharacterized protein n=1 Tax=Malus domestica TaxID=3750 RepID=A0A498KG45_MALDO|nr:hypothetical protein DVH24_006631 [Malus domestica]
MIEYDDRLREVERRNGESVSLKKQLEVTKKQLETTIIEVSKVKWELQSALVEVSGLKMSMPTERDAAVQEFLVDPSSDDDSDNEASIGEQSQESEDGLEDADECGDGDVVETQSDIVRGSTSYEDDS